jgi:hypothetical protein
MKKKILALCLLLALTGCGTKQDMKAFVTLADSYIKEEKALINTLIANQGQKQLSSITRNKDYLKLQDLAEQIQNYKLETSSVDDIDLFNQFKQQVAQMEKMHEQYATKKKKFSDLRKKINYDRLQELITSMKEGSSYRS